jgi:tetratricopeptide (TPR) repeat protein
MRVLATVCLLSALVALAAPPALASSDSRDAAAAAALIQEGVKNLQAGQVERATRQFERAIQMRPNDPTGYVYLARAHGAAQRFEEARKVLARASIHAREDRKVRYDIELTRGDLFRDEGNNEPARACYKRAAGMRFFNKEARRRLEALDSGAAPARPD